MFIGAINHKLRAFFWDQATILDGRDIYVGCSGNFTIEQIITRRCPDAKVYSNDIAFYSSLVGFALTGRDMEVEITDPEYNWLRAYLDKGPAAKIAVLLLLMEMLKFEKQGNPFQLRMWNHYLFNWEKYLDTTIEKVAKGLENIRIEAYETVDVFDYFPRDGVNIGFLPTYVGGYEKLYERVDQIFSWDEPAYGILDEERREATVRKMTENDYILYDDIERDDLPCLARVDQFGKKAVYIYSNLDFDRGLFRRKLGEKVSMYRLLGVDEEILADAVISIVKSDNNVINHYRNIYLKKGIECAAGDLCYLVFAGEKLFGFLIFKGFSKMGDASSIYLLSDFVVNSRHHRRLAKLLLIASLSREVKTELEEALIRRLSSVMTTAFTDRPVSMKYRGVYKLLKRGDGFLNYGSDFKDYSLKEVIPQWLKKHDKR